MIWFYFFAALGGDPSTGDYRFCGTAVSNWRGMVRNKLKNEEIT